MLSRTLAFTFVNVGLTMILGTLIALLLTRLGKVMRTFVTLALVSVWATPWIVAVAVWQWMVDFEFGVLNWTLTQLHLGSWEQHNWFDNPWQGFAVITALVVWQAIPFVTITLYAGLAQMPGELVEAAKVDGASPWLTFRLVIYPMLKPIFVILTSLSIIWDFQIFNQVWVMLNSNPPSDYYLMSMYSFVESFKVSQYGRGAAIAVVMVAVLAVVSIAYVRQMVKLGEVRR